jgi:hypothetical protein
MGNRKTEMEKLSPSAQDFQDYFGTLDIDIKHLQVYDCPEKRYIYALFFKDILVYIGETRDIGHRIYFHKRDKTFDKVLYVHSDLSGKELREIERLLIVKFKPKYNVKHADALYLDPKDLLTN